MTRAARRALVALVERTWPLPPWPYVRDVRAVWCRRHIWGLPPPPSCKRGQKR